jgi:hypothetical protein
MSDKVPTALVVEEVSAELGVCEEKYGIGGGGKCAGVDEIFQYGTEVSMRLARGGGRDVCEEGEGSFEGISVESAWRLNDGEPGGCPCFSGDDNSGSPTLSFALSVLRGMPCEWDGEVSSAGASSATVEGSKREVWSCVGAVEIFWCVVSTRFGSGKGKNE